MFAPARGTRSFQGDELEQRKHLGNLLLEWAQKNNFLEIQLPTIEYSDLFVGSNEVGENILEKEIFFLEGKKYALKPEGTISIAREVINQKALDKVSSPLKFCYLTQCFRYERPQKGRYREFTQFGIEIVNASSIFYEVELIFSMNKFLREKLGLNPILKLNYLSSSKIKKEWSKELTKYFTEHSDKLNQISKERIINNPIRILDDKQVSKLKIIKDAPKISHFFSEEEKERIKEIQKCLRSLNLKYQWDENLVRGLDYYTGIVFEWQINDLAIAGGGRYDELFDKFQTGKAQKKAVPSLGMAIGFDRLQLALNEVNYEWPFLRNKEEIIYICYLLPKVESKILNLIQDLKNEGVKVETNWDSQDLASHFKYSEKLGIKWLLIYGEKESLNKEIILKRQYKNYQIILPLDNKEVLIQKVKRTVEFDN